MPATRILCGGKTTLRAQPRWASSATNALSEDSALSDDAPVAYRTHEGNWSGADVTRDGLTPVIRQAADETLGTFGSWRTGRRRAQNSHGAHSKVSKVFVGGVPQELDDTELHDIFSQYGYVKKAWLLRMNGESSFMSQSRHRSHRGFGFVVFGNGSSLDLLLGDKDSCFIYIRGDRKVEVKRAVAQHLMRHVPSYENYDENGPSSGVHEEPYMQCHRSRRRNAFSESREPLDEKPPDLNFICERAVESSERPAEAQQSEECPEYWSGSSLHLPSMSPVQSSSSVTWRPYSMQNDSQWAPAQRSYAPCDLPALTPVNSGGNASLMALLGLLSPVTEDDGHIEGRALQLGLGDGTSQNLERTLVNAMPDHYDD